MIEENWDDCLEKSSAIEVSKNPFKIKSLIETAKGRIKFVEQISLEPNNSNYIFEIYYSSLLEILHSIVLSNNYSVSNHICLGFYLKEIAKREDLFQLFNDCRIKRNSLVYYEQKMDFETASKLIQKCKKLIEELEKLL